MPSIKAHCAISRQRTGFDFMDVHCWIDNPPEAKILGVNHRIARHAYTVEDEKYIKDYWDKKMGFGWGDKAVIEWLFHIAIDNIHTTFKLSKQYYGDKTFNYTKIEITESGFVNFKFDKRDDDKLKQTFRTSE